MSESQPIAVALRLFKTDIMQKTVFILSFITLFIFLNTAEAQQRTTYQSLLQRSDQPSSYIDQAVLPVSDSTAAALVFFRLDYDFVPFLRTRGNMEKPFEDADYFAPVRMGIEFFEGNVSESGRPSRNSVSVYRDFWSDTVWVSSFEQTKSRFDHVEGLLWTQLDNGRYHYELQLGRGDSNRDLPSRRRNLNVPVQSESTKGSLILASETSNQSDHFTGTFLNYGNNILYGEDFDLLIHFPGTADSLASEYTLQVLKRLPGDSEETEETPVFESTVTGDEIFYAVFDTTNYEGQNQINFALRKTAPDEGFAFATVGIPNSEFENAGYRIRVLESESEETIAQRDVLSRWINMPVSLYNLDVAIGQLSYIVDEERLRSINSGSRAERERKFREFWEQRDPTPETEFNELMTEYYRRIDYAFSNFSSIQTPGYETDQGRAYILFGPPDNIERRFPTDGPRQGGLDLSEPYTHF